jgi:hypothetical protein
MHPAWAFLSIALPRDLLGPPFGASASGLRDLTPTKACQEAWNSRFPPVSKCRGKGS